MSVLSWILVLSFAGGVMSVLAAGFFALTARASWVPMLISYAIGALLGAAFLDVLPEAVAASGDIAATSATVLGGILAFFLMEKLVLWRHCHIEDCEGHETAPVEPIHVGHADHDRGRSGVIIMFGDTFHNFVDGVLIAAAFMESVHLGVVTSLAIIAHEIPQEVGDFMILLHSGFSRTKALLFNMFSSFAMMAGGLLAYFALSVMQGAVPTFLALAAASMIYVAVADLLPGLHKHTALKATFQQVSLIASGIASIWFAEHLVEMLLG